MIFFILPDPAVTAFVDVTQGVYAHGTLLSVSFTADIENQAASSPGNDILATTGDNYAFDVLFADADINSNIATNTQAGSNINIVTGLTVGLLASGASLTVSGSVDLTLPTANCNTLTFLCVRLSEGAGASYVDIDNADSSNAICIDITSRIYCSPGNDHP